MQPIRRTRSDRVVLNTDSARKNKIKFNKGEILKGTVLGINPDGTISLQIKDNLVDAVSEVAVSPGQHLYLLVERCKNRRTYLKAMTQQELNRMDDNNLSDNLRSLGVPPDANTILIARGLLQNNLSITRQNMAEIFKAISLIGDITAQNLEVAIFALKHNIPLDKDILPSINQFISSDGDLSRLVQEMIEILVQLETIVRSYSLSSVVPAFVVMPGSFTLTMSDLAATKEVKLLYLTELIKILRMTLDSATGGITESGPGINSTLHDLIGNRKLLLDNLRCLLEMVKTSVALIKAPEVQELLARIGNLQQQITGQALFNSVVKLNRDVFANSYYFSFPVEMDKQLSYCQLLIQKNIDKRPGQQDNIKLTASLNTSALGIVLFHIDWSRQGHIQLRGVVETVEARDFVEKNIAALLLGLGELGYKANNLGIKVAEDPEELILKPQIKEEEQHKTGPFSIDITA